MCTIIMYISWMLIIDLIVSCVCMCVSAHSPFFVGSTVLLFTLNIVYCYQHYYIVEYNN